MKPTSSPSSFAEEFPYGWRYVKRVLPDGDETLDQVPLTLEDVLHPQENDVIPANTDHDRDCAYLADVLRTRPLAPAFALVTHDLLVHWGVAGIRNHSPDIALFVGLSRDPRPTGLLELPDLGGRCELIIEVVSPSTRKNDVIDKFDHYFRIGIPLYVIIDQKVEDGPRTLRAYRRTPAQYVEIQPDDQGRVLLPPVRLMLRMRDQHAVCFDAESGQELGDYARIARALEEADRLAEQREQDMEEQIQARQGAERREKDARKEADRHREEADRQRQLREAIENERRQAEDQAAQRIRDLEELVKRLQASALEP